MVLKTIVLEWGPGGWGPKAPDSLSLKRLIYIYRCGQLSGVVSNIGNELTAFVDLVHIRNQNDCFGAAPPEGDPEDSRPQKPFIYIDVAHRLA